MITTLTRRGLSVHSGLGILVIVIVGIVVANLALLFAWLVLRRRRARPSTTGAYEVAEAPRRISAGNSNTTATAHSPLIDDTLAEKLGPLMPPPRAHVAVAPFLYARSIAQPPPPAPVSLPTRRRRASNDSARAPPAVHLTPLPSRRSSRRAPLSPVASLRRPSRPTTPSAISVADSASMYSVMSAPRERDVIAGLPTSAGRWRWRPRSQTPVLVLRDAVQENEEDGYTTWKGSRAV